MLHIEIIMLQQAIGFIMPPIIPGIIPPPQIPGIIPGMAPWAFSARIDSLSCWFPIAVGICIVAIMVKASFLRSISMAAMAGWRMRFAELKGP